MVKLSALLQICNKAYLTKPCCFECAVMKLLFFYKEAMLLQQPQPSN